MSVASAVPNTCTMQGPAVHRHAPVPRRAVRHLGLRCARGARCAVLCSAVQCCAVLCLPCFAVPSQIRAARRSSTKMHDRASCHSRPPGLPPFQMLMGRGVSAKSDIWSLGVVLWELCSGVCMEQRSHAMPLLAREGGGPGQARSSGCACMATALDGAVCAASRPAPYGLLHRKGREVRQGKQRRWVHPPEESAVRPPATCPAHLPCTAGKQPQRGQLTPLLVPQECPAEVAALQQACMSESPAERPTAGALGSAPSRASTPCLQGVPRFTQSMCLARWLSSLPLVCSRGAGLVAAPAPWPSTGSSGTSSRRRYCCCRRGHALAGRSAAGGAGGTGSAASSSAASSGGSGVGSRAGSPCSSYDDATHHHTHMGHPQGPQPPGAAP